MTHLSRLLRFFLEHERVRFATSALKSGTLMRSGLSWSVGELSSPLSRPARTR